MKYATKVHVNKSHKSLRKQNNEQKQLNILKKEI